MARTKSPHTLARIAEASAHAFAMWGFQRATVADVVARSGLSLGTVYRYADSKAALLDLALRHAFGAPVPTEPTSLAKDPDATLGYLRKLLRVLDPAPTLRVCADSKALPTRAQLETVLGELWDAIRHLWLALRIIDRSKREWPELLALMNEKFHHPTWRRLTRLLARCSEAGVIDSLGDPEATAHTIGELMAWSAMHRRLQIPHSGVDDARAREACLTLILNGLGGGQPS